MKRLAGQAGRTVGYLLHHTGMVIITVFFVVALSLGGLAYRLSLGPVQIPWITSRLASAVSGQGIDISITSAALAWGGYKNGGGVPLFLQLGDIVARNSTGVELAEIPSARLVFLPGALVGTQAPIRVTSSDALLAGSNVPVSLVAAIRLGFLHLSKADLNFTLGAGVLGGATMGLPISGGRFHLDIAPDSVDLQNGTLVLAQIQGAVTNVAFSGQGLFRQLWQGSLHVTGDTMQADALQQYWPPGLAVQTRNWVTQNISAGNASAADFTLGLSAPVNLTSLTLQTMTGHFNGTGLSVGWVPHAAPITGVSGVFTLTDKDTIDISADRGNLGGVTLSAAKLRISGVSHKDQLAALSVPVSGNVASVIAVLNAPPLNMLKLAPPTLLQASGGVTATVTAHFPLKNDLTLREVDLDVAAHVTDAAAPTPLAGVSFSNGTVDIAASTKNLAAKAVSTLDGQAASFNLTADFGPGQPVIRSSLQTLAGKNLLRQFGLEDGDEVGGVSGAVPLNVRIDQDAAGITTATLDADLTGAALRLKFLGWSKKAGEAGHFELTAAMARNGSGTVSAVSATAPGLDIAGQAVAGQPGTLRFSRLRIGASSAAGVITEAADGAPWRVELTGSALDASALLSQEDSSRSGLATAKPASAAAPKMPSGPHWQVDLRFERLILGDGGGPVLHALVFQGDGQGSSIFNAQAHAVDDASQTVNLKVSRADAAMSRETIHLDTPDGGFLLRAMGLYGNLEHGTTQLDAEYSATSDVTGVLKIERFRVLRAPVIGKILQGITLYGVADATSGPGLVFDRLVAPFSIGEGRLTLNGARAFSSSLGFTASGSVGLNDGTADLDTTIIPAYLLNSAPGKIPVIGKLFSAETGGGLFAIRAKISGKLSDPNVAVNPFSAFTPGLLRDVFGIGSSKP